MLSTLSYGVGTCEIAVIFNINNLKIRLIMTDGFTASESNFSGSSFQYLTARNIDSPLKYSWTN